MILLETYQESLRESNLSLVACISKSKWFFFFFFLVQVLKLSFWYLMDQENLYQIDFLLTFFSFLNLPRMWVFWTRIHHSVFKNYLLLHSASDLKFLKAIFSVSILSYNILRFWTLSSFDTLMHTCSNPFSFEIPPHNFSNCDYSSYQT